MPRYLSAEPTPPLEDRGALWPSLTPHTSPNILLFQNAVGLPCIPNISRKKENLNWPGPALSAGRAEHRRREG
jgi:hypothetical protein